MTDPLESVALIVAFGSLAVTVALVVYAVIHAARYQPKAMLVIALSIIAVMGLFIYAVASTTEVLTISATAVGAMAGALTSLFRQDPPERPRTGDDDGPGQDPGPDQNAAPGPSQDDTEG